MGVVLLAVSGQAQGESAQCSKYAEASGAPGGAAKLEESLQDFLKAVQDSEAYLKQSPAYAGDTQQARAYEHLLRVITIAIDEELLEETNHPFFTYFNLWNRWGGDNPDQRYHKASIAGDGVYRIWGNRGGSHSLQFQLADTSGEVGSVVKRPIVAAVDAKDLVIGKDGSFELIIAKEKQQGNWLRSGDSSYRLVVREIFSDWNQKPSVLHIDRVDCLGQPAPPRNTAVTAARIKNAAAAIRVRSKDMPEFIQRHWKPEELKNQLVHSRDPAAQGGMAGRFMSNGVFDIETDEALVITSWPVAPYQGIQLTDLWMASLDYANNQSSLNNSQAHLSEDGAYRYVIAHQDPGVRNWLDTVGLSQGVILMRFDGVPGGRMPENKWPTIQKVKLSELKGLLTKGDWLTSPEEREAALRKRRQQIQQREGF